MEMEKKKGERKKWRRNKGWGWNVKIKRNQVEEGSLKKKDKRTMCIKSLKETAKWKPIKERKCKPQ